MALRRGVGLVLTLIGMAVFVSVAGILLLYLVMSRGPSVPDRATLVLRPGGALQEVDPRRRRRAADRPGRRQRSAGLSKACAWPSATRASRAWC